MTSFGVLSPGVRLMRCWRVPVKLGVLTAILLLPLAIACAALIVKLHDAVQQTRQQMDGVAAIRVVASAQAAGGHADEWRRQIHDEGWKAGLHAVPGAELAQLADLAVYGVPSWLASLERLQGSDAKARPAHAKELGRELAALQRLPVEGDIRTEMAAALSASQAAMARADTGEAFSRLRSLHALVLSQLKTGLEARQGRLMQWLWVSYAASALGIVLVGYILLSFYCSFIADFGHAVDVMRQMASGNLRIRVQVRGRDELAELARLLERTIGSISAMVAEVRSNSALVAYAGKSLATGNRELAERTEQQAASLEQTSASVQELTSTVQQNAHTASESDQQAVLVRTTAEAGAQAVGQAVGSVEAIQRSAQQMNEIISVIDSLAFQTNILALNAAVEAARAGEQGRGFPVVASEVRSLAQRSAESAREIRQLIETSRSQVETSVREIRTAGENMTRIVEGVRGVAANMSLISTASAEQSSGLSEISTAVRQLDHITQRNAQMVERAVEQAGLLERRATHLSQAVSLFSLQQGTAEEAMEMVARAQAWRTRVGREAFVRGLTDQANGFFDRDMYIFALDALGTYRAFGGRPDKVGTRVQDILGVDGSALLADIVAQAEHEPGWVEYDIVNPSTGSVQTKMSYVMKMDDLYVGCGIYKSVALAA